MRSFAAGPSVKRFVPSLCVKKEGQMFFIVTGQGEAVLVSSTCDTAPSALEKARRLTDQGVRDVLIDAHGQEYAPGDFNRLFVEPDTGETGE